jgi:hypothetical protein
MNIVDNYLSQEEFKSIKEVVGGTNFPWFHSERTATAQDNTDGYFIHTFYNNYAVNSDMFSVLTPILAKINPKALIRCRAVLYTSKEKLIEHGRHYDFDYTHKTLILYLNSNNGFTRLHDGQCVNSVENRALFFDGSLKHNSTNCTDQPARKLITISYF